MLEPLPPLHPPQQASAAFARNLPSSVALKWLALGFRDLTLQPLTSLAYGTFLFVLSLAILGLLYALGLLYLALPAIAGFMIIGPFLALGLYHKSRLLAEGGRPSFVDIALCRPASGSQIAFAGLLLSMLLVFWLRSADLLYALFFGLSPFPGAGEALQNVLMSTRGWVLISVGSMVGAVFAAFAFAISLFSLPMMMEEKCDALTALGTSFAMTAQNRAVSLVWGLIVAAGIALSVWTGFLGLIVVFPILGHGTWHAFRDIRGNRG